MRTILILSILLTSQLFGKSVSEFIDELSPKTDRSIEEGRKQLSEASMNYLMEVQNYHVGAVMGIIESEKNLGHKFVVLYLRQFRNDPRFVVDYAGHNGWHPRDNQDAFFYKIKGNDIEIITKKGMIQRVSSSKLLKDEKSRVLSEFPITFKDRESEYYR